MGAHALTAGSITRPGTAEPRISEGRATNVGIENGGIIAPTPKKYHQTSPPFALPDGPFGSESLDISRDDHSSKSPDNNIEGIAHIFNYSSSTDEMVHPAIERQEESFKIPLPKKSNVHQRAPGQPELSQYQPKLLQRRAEHRPMPNDCGDQDQDGSNGPLQRNKKRMRELDEVDDPDVIDRNAKRFKNHEAEENDEVSVSLDSGTPFL